ncbi:hypothetical protein B0H14DRAFT_2586669 [Mycena olivaceomarginata]|nr:hypothetical protein B0H14DRAFT_2586669 [Mycena olivaceomarginata]
MSSFLVLLLTLGLAFPLHGHPQLYPPLILGNADSTARREGLGQTCASSVPRTTYSMRKKENPRRVAIKHAPHTSLPLPPPRPSHPSSPPSKIPTPGSGPAHFEVRARSTPESRAHGIFRIQISSRTPPSHRSLHPIVIQPNVQCQDLRVPDRDADDEDAGDPRKPPPKKVESLQAVKTYGGARDMGMHEAIAKGLTTVARGSGSRRLSTASQSRARTSHRSRITTLPHPRGTAPQRGPGPRADIAATHPNTMAERGGAGPGGRGGWVEEWRSRTLGRHPDNVGHPPSVPATARHAIRPDGGDRSGAPVADNRFEDESGPGSPDVLAADERRHRGEYE